MKRITLVVLTLGLAAFLAAPSPVSADSFGVRGGIYSFKNAPDKPFIGAELLAHAGDDIYFNPNVEYVFVDGGKYWTFNFDAHWDLPTHGGPYVWIGGGLAVVWADPDVGASDTQAHANLLAGIGFRTRSHVTPYIQVKLITTDPNTFVAAGGLRF